MSRPSWPHAYVAIALAGAIALAWHRSTTAQGTTASADRLSHPAIQYGVRALADPVTRVQADLRAGTVRLDDTDSLRYLKSLLRALRVSEVSQMMVFSKTSLQSSRIEASNPRALYFNDSVSVGWVPGGLIEIASQDPEQGVQFYAVDPRVSAPAIVRRDDCLRCHHSDRTSGIPGMIEPMTHRRPLETRWGGWYVTGDLGPVRHFGNVDVNARPPREAVNADFNWKSLRGKIDTSKYASEFSDVAALMVFEHQMQMMNLLTKANWDARVAGQERSGAVEAAIREDADAIVDYLLFVDEAPIRAPIVGTSGFKEEFSKRGPFDHLGRSLRQLDLQTRLLKYPCSYMIYSEQFEHLPSPVKVAVYARLSTVLAGNDRTGRFSHLSSVDRVGILNILRETKHDLPASFGTGRR